MLPSLQQCSVQISTNLLINMYSVFQLLNLSSLRLQILSYIPSCHKFVRSTRALLAPPYHRYPTSSAHLSFGHSSTCSLSRGDSYLNDSALHLSYQNDSTLYILKGGAHCSYSSFSSQPAHTQLPRSSPLCKAEQPEYISHLLQRTIFADG